MIERAYNRRDKDGALNDHPTPTSPNSRAIYGGKLLASGDPLGRGGTSEVGIYQNSAPSEKAY